MILFLLLLLIATPSAIANELPLNYMIWRGKVYDLNHLAHKGVKPVYVESKPIPVSAPVPTKPKLNQEIENQGAKDLILLEYLSNQK